MPPLQFADETLSGAYRFAAALILQLYTHADQFTHESTGVAAVGLCNSELTQRVKTASALRHHALEPPANHRVNLLHGIRILTINLRTTEGLMCSPRNCPEEPSNH